MIKRKNDTIRSSSVKKGRLIQQHKRRLKATLKKERSSNAASVALAQQKSFTTTPQRQRTKHNILGYDTDGYQHGMRLSTLGGYRMAMKRVLCHAGITDLLEQHEITGTGQTVTLWEHRLAASMLLASRDFYNESEDVIRQYHRQCRDAAIFASDADAGADVVRSWKIHRIMGDATNCTATKSLKAHVVQLRSLFRVGADDDGDDDEEKEAWTSTVMPDLALVPSSCRGIHTRALYFRQMSNAGAPSWLLAASYDGLHVRVFLFITDAGPDQKECVEIIKKECSSDPLTLIWHDLCALHQLNLIVKKTLEQDGGVQNPQRVARAVRCCGCTALRGQVTVQTTQRPVGLCQRV